METENVQPIEGETGPGEESSSEFWIMVTIAIASVIVMLFYLRKKPAPPAPQIQAKTTPQPAAKSQFKGKAKTDKADREGPSLKILWGSQTGTAEDFSETLSKEAQKYGFAASTVDLEEYDTEDLADEKLAVFVLATYGEGEPTDNAKEFYDWLMSEDREEDSLSGLKYTVFGLGNKTYEHYNAVARTVDKRLHALGARRLYAQGEGDDDSSLEEDFAKWKKTMWAPLCKEFNLSADSGPQEENFVIEGKCDIVYVDEDSDEAKEYLEGLKEQPHAVGTTIRAATHDSKNPFICEVVENMELYEDASDRSCRHIEIALPDHITYEAGDHVGVMPKNESVLVDEIAERLGVSDQLDKIIALVPKTKSLASSSGGHRPRSTSTKDNNILGPISLRAALTELYELTAPPRKSVLKALVQYTSDPAEKQKLKVLSSDDDSSLPAAEQYGTWVKEDRRTTAEVLRAFPSCKPPLGHMLELLPAMVPRYYSISSSPKAHSGRLHITSVVVQFTTGTGRVHNGVCSNYYTSLVPSAEKKATLPIFVRKSTFRVPRSLDTPMIMIGPGTGLAPFRGFIHERQHLARQQSLTSSPGENVLFFGCRDRNKDFLYKQELSSALDHGLLSHLFLAFSREQAHKVYVQDRLSENAELVWELLGQKQAHFYICGDAAQMAPAVRAVLLQIIEEQGKKSKDEAEKFLAQMQESNRYSTDVWF